jgi:hypothetical protein
MSVATISTIRTLSIAGLVSASLAASSDQPISRGHADQLERKFLTIAAHGAAGTGEARLTRISEAECNAYLRYRMNGVLPAGVTDPSVRILGNGRVQGSATVDLDALRKEAAESDDWLDPAQLLGGRLPVTATGVLHTSGGVGRLDIESATVAGVPVPQSVLRKVVGYYSRSADNPRGVDLGRAFELPSGIREIRVAQGEAVVVQ